MSLDGIGCLVLGGGGFLGTNLCLGLAAAGARVEAYGRRPAHPDLDPIRWHEAEFSDTARLVESVRGKELVFHLLGSRAPAQSNHDPIGDIEGRLFPTLRLIEACQAAGVRRLLFASSGGTVYGVTGTLPIAETAPTEPITAYGINMLAVEKYLALNRHMGGLDSIVLRISNAYGPFQHARLGQGLVGAMLARAMAGETIDIWGEGSIVRDFVYVDDVVDALIAASGYEGDARVFNVGSGAGRSVREVAEAVVAVTEIAADRIRYLPGRPTDVPANVLDISRMCREMGWSARVGWAEGLAKTAAWMRGRRDARE